MSQLLSLCIVSCLFVGMTISIQQLDSPNFEVYQILCALTSSFFLISTTLTVVLGQLSSDRNVVLYKVQWIYNVSIIAFFFGIVMFLVCLIYRFMDSLSSVGSIYIVAIVVVFILLFLIYGCMGRWVKRDDDLSYVPANERYMQEFADIISQTLHEQMRSKDTFANLTAIN